MSFKAKPLLTDQEVQLYNLLRLAVEDLTQTFGSRYPQGPAFWQRLRDVETAVAEARACVPADLLLV